MPDTPAKPPLDLKQHQKRADVAWQEQQVTQSVLDDVYKYVLPFRRSSKNGGKNNPVAVELTDITAQSSLMKAAGKLANDLCPPDQRWFDLEPGLVAKEERDASDARLALQAEAAKMRPFFMDGQWTLALHEFCLDLQIGTAAMLIVETDHEPYMRFITVAVEEIALEKGAYNTITAVFFRRQYTVRQIYEMFPEGTFDTAFMDKLKTNPEQSMDLEQDTVWNAQLRIWETIAYVRGAQEVINRTTSYTCPWIIGRYWCMPNEVYGRGRAQLALPSVKTLNKTLEITLIAAAIATMGIYTVADDGVLNAETLRIEPGAMWFVQRNAGGISGRSIERLDTPGKFDVSNLILEELRKQIREAFADADVAEKSGNPRSATEMIERFKNIALSNQGVYGRAIQEILTPAVQRVAEILYNKKILARQYRFDQMMVQVRITSPIAQAFRASQAQPLLEYMQMAVSLLGAQASSLLLDQMEMMQDVGLAMGIEQKYIRSSDDRGRMQETVQQLVQVAVQQAAQQQMQQQAQAQGLPNAATPSNNLT